jgi:putative ABC transport system permease protein
MSKLRVALEVDPQLRVQVIAEREYYARQFAALLHNIRRVAIGLALMLAIGAAVATINTVHGAIVSRQRSIATLRAFGFASSPIAAAVFAESALLSSAGGIAGGLLAYAIGDGFAASLLNPATAAPLSFEAAVTASSLAWGILSALLLGLLAAIPPSISVARTPIVVGLRAL